MSEEVFDVIVMGAGPGGCSVATLTAQYGHKVLLLEREIFPRFKIGESLMPGTYWALQKLGMLEKMKKSHFPQKYSIQFYTKDGNPTSPFYFFSNDPHESSQTWQVLRSEFDQMLADNAAEKGADVRFGINVSDVIFEGDRATGVVCRQNGGSEERFFGRVIVDASGQNALISRKLKISRQEPKLKKAAVYSHFRGAIRDPGIDEGATLVIHTDNEEGWFWYIPLPENIVSIGVVGSMEYLVTNREGEPQQIFEEEVARCKPLQWRMAPSQQLFPMKVTKDFSYRATRIAGDGWVLVGDAFGFLDPIYSSGVLLALTSGQMAADAIHEGLGKGDLSAAQLGKFGDEFAAGMEAIRKLVYAFYTKEFSFAKFLREFPDTRRNIIDILIGNVFLKDVSDLFGPLGSRCELPEFKKLQQVVST